MEVLNMEDQPDGSVILEIEMTNKEQTMLVKYAILDLIRKECERRCFNCGALISKKVLVQNPDTELCSECIDLKLKGDSYENNFCSSVSK